MKLMIVESPGKVKKIQSYLGDGWIVKASVGHVRDLPTNEIGIDIENGFKPNYVLTERGTDVVKKLRSLANSAEVVYLATDMDREGEAIAWHLKVALGLKTYQRVTFTEISKSAIAAAISKPRQLNMGLVAAQESRRVLDRLVGYRVSPVVGNVFNHKGLSAGRVQTPAVGLVVRRELAIRNFVPLDYFDVYLAFDADSSNPWYAKWEPKNLMVPGQTHWTDRSFAQQVAQTKSVRVDSYSAEPEARRPPAPLITSTLQQAASVVLKLAPVDTMKLAQTLYEQGLITYMRTDNPNLSDEAAHQARSWLNSNGFANDIAKTLPRWSAKGGAQEAHEAIRPTDFNMREITLTDPDTPRLQALYELIWLRSVASQMRAAEYDTQTLQLSASLENKSLQFVAKARALRYSGWLKLLSADRTEVAEEIPAEGDTENSGVPKNHSIPALVSGSNVVASSGKVIACKTRPPARYTEASLVKELESEGIGRPSTYAAIMQGIVNRGYIEIVKRKLFASPVGIALYAVLELCAFAKTPYTARIEERLDQIVHNRDSFKAVVSEVNQQLDVEIQQLAQLKRELPKEAVTASANNTGKNNKTRSKKTNAASTAKVSTSGAAVKSGDTCPTCKKGEVIYKTIKTGPNAGKPIYACSDRSCRFFAWASKVS